MIRFCIFLFPVAIISVSIFAHDMILASDIMTQLENAKEGIANPGQGLCLGACPENRSIVVLVDKWGYNDMMEFLKDYNNDNLVNKTELKLSQNKTGNFCLGPLNCVNVTQEALDTKALFDKYW